MLGVAAPEVPHKTLVIGLLPQSLKFTIGHVAAHPFRHQLQHRGLSCRPEPSQCPDLRVANIRRRGSPRELKREELIVTR
jgi:hypothetical protein